MMTSFQPRDPWGLAKAIKYKPPRARLLRALAAGPAVRTQRIRGPGNEVVAPDGTVAFWSTAMVLVKRGLAIVSDDKIHLTAAGKAVLDEMGGR